LYAKFDLLRNRESEELEMKAHVVDAQSKSCREAGRGRSAYAKAGRRVI
jgi:hypothetical protein